MTDGTMAENGDRAVYQGTPSYPSIGSLIQMDRIYFEHNNGNANAIGGAIHEITVLGNTRAYSETVLQVTNCEFHPQANSYKPFSIDNCIADIRRNNGFDYSKFLATSHSQTTFDMNGHNTNNAADHLLLSKAVLGFVSCRDRNYQGDVFTLNGGKVEILGTAAPVAGTWMQGDFVRNKTPAAGGTFGWGCTTGGTPGTWEAWNRRRVRPSCHRDRGIQILRFASE